MPNCVLPLKIKNVFSCSLFLFLGVLYRKWETKRVSLIRLFPYRFSSVSWQVKQHAAKYHAMSQANKLAFKKSWADAKLTEPNTTFL